MLKSQNHSVQSFGWTVLSELAEYGILFSLGLQQTSSPVLDEIQLAILQTNAIPSLALMLKSLDNVKPSVWKVLFELAKYGILVPLQLQQVC
jgi:hypothetical protein